MEKRYFFTSESVTEGHPDKVCDQISDGILDAILREDRDARVACEVALSPGLILLMGEISTSAHIDPAKVARKVVLDIGYNNPAYGLDGHSCSVLTALNGQSPDIAQGVNRLSKGDAGDGATGTLDAYDKFGAGDQGIMFGYACRETEELMPLTVSLSHALARRLAEVRHSGLLPYLRPDGKTQVTVEYKGHVPVRVDAIVVSTQHDEDVTLDQLKADVLKHVVEPVVPARFLDENTRYFVNPTGRFVIGGPAADAGLTGRKVIVDTYGGVGRHGGGAFSGKDATKVDRSGSYASRWVAKNIVAAGLADRCEVQVAYAIGVVQPVALFVETFGTGQYDDESLAEVVQEVFDLRPAAIIDRLDLTRPIYRSVAAYGHFGRPDLDLPWERVDMVDTLLEKIGDLGLVKKRQAP